MPGFLPYPCALLLLLDPNPTGIEPAVDPESSAAQMAPELPVLVPPELASFVEALYPPGLDLGEQRVLLQILVDEQGAVEEAKVTQGEEPFASMALWAVRQCRFRPALEAGVPTAVDMPFEYVFPPPAVNVAGQLKLRGGGQLAANAALAIGDRTVMTNEEGRFEVRNLAPGEHRVRSLDPERFMEDVTFSLSPGERVDLELWLSPPSEEQEIVGLYERRRPPTVRRSITAAEVRSTPGTLGDPVRAVQNLPGVVRTPLDAGWMMVRGGDPKDTGLYLDGIRVPLVFHLMGLTSVIHPAMVGRVDFYPGATDVRYGRATSGAVDLVSRSVEQGDRELRVGADLLLTGAYTRVPIGKEGGFAAAIRRSWLDGALAVVAGARLFGLEPGAEKIAPRFWDWQARYDRRNMGIFAFGYTDSLNASFGGEGSDAILYDVGTERIHGHYSTSRFGPRLLITPVVGVEWQAVSYAEYRDERRKQLLGGRVEVLDPGNTPLGWSAGLDIEGGRFSMSVHTEDHPEMERDANYFSADPYVDVRVGVDPSLTAGLRFENLFVSDQLPRGMPSPRIQGRMPLTRVQETDIGLFAAAGVYHGWPYLDQVIGLPNGPYLKLERSLGTEIGIRAAAPLVSFESDTFYRKLENVTMVEEDGTLGQGEGEAVGVENILRVNQGGWNGWLSYTWSKSLRREEETSAWQPYTYDQRHYLVAVMSRDLGRDWVVAGRFRYASGYPVADGVYEGSDLLTGESVCLTDPSAEIWNCPDSGPGQRLALYHALDLKVSRVFSFRRWSLDAYFDLQNVYNHRVPEPVITGSIDIKNPYSVGFPILPVFGVQGLMKW